MRARGVRAVRLTGEESEKDGSLGFERRVADEFGDGDVSRARSFTHSGYPRANGTTGRARGRHLGSSLLMSSIIFSSSASGSSSRRFAITASS